jgi:hypothetical protein
MTNDTLKTSKTKESPAAFLNSIEDADRRRDAKAINKLMRDVSGHKPAMWGESIVGYGAYTYTRSNGKEFSFMRLGFSPRKEHVVLYILPGYEDHQVLLEKLGKHKKGKACLYIKRLDDIHLPTLKKLITTGWRDMQRLYPE